jgi:membrane associated rhomboid family serine protease
MILPFSTDVHDGKIRLAAIEIIAICFVVHFFVAGDIKQKNKEFEKVATEWNEERMRQLYAKADSGAISAEEMVQELTGSGSTEETNKALKSLKKQMNEVREKTLLYKLGLVPAKIKLYSFITSLFTHSGWLHLIFNMLFFYVCGVAMEQYWGYWKFLAIYIACGLAADGTFLLTSLLSGDGGSRIPLVGASGAIAGCMGAFVITHPTVKVKLFYFFSPWLRGVFKLPARWYFGFWFGEQIISALTDSDGASGVAFTAHIGGFIAGAIFGKIIRSEDDDAIIDHRRFQRQKVKEQQTDEQNFPRGFYYSPAKTSGTVDDMIEKKQEDEVPVAVSAEQGGWNALQAGDSERAVVQFQRAVNCYFQNPTEYRKPLLDLFAGLVKHRVQLPFSQNDYYQWGKQLMQIKEYRHAVICFDLAAFTDGNAHIRKNSLLNAALLRVKTGDQIDKAKRDMAFLVSSDPEGIAAQQAREILEQIARTFSN